VSPETSDDRRICDYEGSPYRSVFWEETDRRYEDLAERYALRDLLPPHGRRLVEIGAGFGRLVDEYRGYEQVILLDYARSMLEDARERLGDRYTYVCADLYRLPFADGALDTVTQIRVLHHVERIDEAFAEVSRSLCAGGSYVLEFANKRNLKAIGRRLAGRQDASPFSQEPWEFVPLNWNFHPRHVEGELGRAGLELRERRAVSHFRHPLLKRLLPASTLARADAALGRPLATLAPSPSQFLRAARLTGGALNQTLWRCPDCGSQDLPEGEQGLDCGACGKHWPRVDGIYMFR
jgi:ubiquinone/menaquinone biosynthesis C-methylase UbiE